MICPFCHIPLSKIINQLYICFLCDSYDCMMSRELPRFITRYEVNSPIQDSYLINKEFCINNFYIKLDFKKKSTIIYKFDLVLLKDPVEFNQLIDFDLINVDSTNNKLKIISTFS